MSSCAAGRRPRGGAGAAQRGGRLRSHHAHRPGRSALRWRQRRRVCGADSSTDPRWRQSDRGHQRVRGVAEPTGGGAGIPVRSWASPCSRTLPVAEVLRPALAKASDLAKRSPRSPAAIHELGTGQTFLGALLHAVYATLCTDTAEHAVAVAIHQEGSSATSGALAGQVSALVYDPEKVPSAWRAQCQ